MMPQKPLIAFLIGAVLVLAMWLGVFTPVNRNSSQNVVFSIEKGEGSRDIGYNLQTQGLIHSAHFLRLYVLATGVSHKLQAGDYLLSPAMSMADIIRKFAAGDIMQEKLTIIEGWNTANIETYLATKGINISIPEEFEGYLFPDTYYVRLGISGDELIEMMRKNFDKKFDESLLQETAKQKKTVHEIVTMASLIEREVQTPEDKKLVSGVLWKRLKYGIALQVDAEPNTYKEQGLPARPIANPGLESITSALFPQESAYLYYLSAKDGTTIFSKTLEEHNIAKATYLKR
jgi:UPF0755 protein